MTYEHRRLMLLAGLACTCATRAHAQCEVWASVGDGVPRVEVVASFDDGSGPALFVGGPMPSPGWISRWDGSAWTDLGDLSGGLGIVVKALTVFDDGTGPALYVGGDFAVAGGVIVNNIARWNGTTWAPLGAGLTDPTLNVVDALVVHDDGSGPALYAGGSFTSSGGVPVNRVARWNGTSWSAVGSSSAGVSGRTLAVFDDGTGPALFAGGGSLWKWDGTMWTSVATVVGSQFAAGLGGIEDLEVFDDGTGPALYAGGAFTATGTAVAHNVARWNGASWSPLGLGIGGAGIAGINPANVIDLHTFDTGMGPRLYAGGWFTEAEGAPASGVAAWDGGTWSNLDGGIGPGPINGVFGFGTHDDGTGPGLYAGGQFFEMGGTPAGNLAVRASFPAASIHCAAESYCTATPNSTGAPAAIFASGSASVAANDLVLGAGPVPNQPGIFFYGAQQASASFGNGTLCIAGRVGRLDVVNAVGNVMTVVLDNTSPPSAATQITPGSTWNFQAWFRDPMPGGASFDLSNGLNLVFSP